TAAWGIYHQVPAPLFYEPTIGDPTLPSQRAMQMILGGEVHGRAVMLRIEGYRKDYSRLAQWTRDGIATGGGTGRSTGADVFLKWDRGPVTGRIAYSFAHARRSDPDAGVVSRSPYDI